MNFPLVKRPQPINPTQAGPYPRGYYLFGWQNGKLWAVECSTEEQRDLSNAVFVSTTFYLSGTNPENLTVHPFEGN